MANGPGDGNKKKKTRSNYVEAPIEYERDKQGYIMVDKQPIFRGRRPSEHAMNFLDPAVSVLDSANRRNRTKRQKRRSESVGETASRNIKDAGMGRQLEQKRREQYPYGYVDSKTREESGRTLGALSEERESGKDGIKAMQNWDKVGGASYGAFQMASAFDVPQDFANKYGGRFVGLNQGTEEFDKAWIAESEANPIKFYNAQYDYIKKNHFDPTIKMMGRRMGVKPENMSDAFKKAIWSFAVQHNKGGTRGITNRAGVETGMSEREVIDRMYRDRMNTDYHFRSSSPEIQQSIRNNRYIGERKDALQLINEAHGENRPILDVNERNQLINDKGQAINYSGDRINELGQLIDEDGNAVNEDGHLIDEDGNVVNEAAKTISENKG